MKFSWFALYCGLLLSISAFSIDILLPSLLAISVGLKATVEQTQLVIPVYMLALGLGNPVYGALSDRHGRRSGIILGLGIYVVGSLVCLVAPSIDYLLFGRFLQGFGAASAPVIGRAMVRDKHSGAELAQNMAIVSVFFALGPMLAPLLGYVIYELFGWRAIFFVLILMALGMILTTYKQPETLPPEARKYKTWSTFWHDTVAVFSHPQSRYFIGLSCFCTALILSFLAHAPVVYASFGTGSGRFAVLFSLSSVGIILGQFANHYLINTVGSVAATVFGGVVIALTSSLMMFFAVAGALNELNFTALMFAFSTSYLIVFSNIVSLTLDPHAQRAGTASAMFGFTSYVAGSLLTGAIAFITGEDVVSWSLCFLAIALIVCAGILNYHRRLRYQQTPI